MRRYLDRDEPTKYERYAEVANVGVYLLIILITAGAALLRWNSRRKKERADRYYRQVLTIRAEIPYASDADRAAAQRNVQSIYDEAFEKLMDERLAANESFQILITLCNDTLQDLAVSAVRSQEIREPGTLQQAGARQSE